VSTIRQAPNGEACGYLLDDPGKDWTWIEVERSVVLLIRKTEDGALVVEAFRKGRELSSPIGALEVAL